MKNECSIVRDLLPLYAEDMLNSDTVAFVEEHLTGCEACKAEFEKIKEPKPTREAAAPAPLLKLKRKLKAKRIQTIALTALFVVALLVSAFAVLDAPVYLPYSEDLVSVEDLGNKGILLTFDKEVTAFDCTVYESPNDKDLYYCEIEAWTSLWDKWFSQQKGTLSTTVMTQDSNPIVVTYVPNNDTKSISIAKYDPNAENRIEMINEPMSTIVLPRLALGFYFILAVCALLVSAIVWFFVRKDAKVRVWVERIALCPLAYIVSSLIISGFEWDGYSLTRDFFLSVFLSLILYCALLLAHNVLQIKKDIKEINQ